MLNDLSVFTERWRKKRPFGFVGNRQRHADPDAYNLYFMDDGTWGKARFGERTGFWLRSGARAEIVLRAFDLAPVRRVVLRFTGGPLGDIVSVRRGWSWERRSVGPGQSQEVALSVGRGLRYYDTFLHVLHLRSRRGGSMSDRTARIALGVLVGLAVILALATDLPRASDGKFWSDAATYRAMAESLARDLDLDFEAEDLARVKSVYPGGPQGVFLKRVPDGDEGSRLVYGKALLYPLAGAPFVRLLGPDRGLLLLNAVALGLALVFGYAERRRAAPAGAALAAVLAVFVLGAVPVYLLWLTPEIFNLGLLTGGLIAWRRGRTTLAAVLVGMAAYSKPTNALLALPLILEAVLARGPWGRRIGEALRRGVLVVAVMAAGFGATWLATGELNYQGGERKAAAAPGAAAFLPAEPRLLLDRTLRRGPGVLPRGRAGRARVRCRRPSGPGRRPRPPRASGLWPRLHPHHPGQLVRGGRDRRQPLLRQPGSFGPRLPAPTPRTVGGPGGGGVDGAPARTGSGFAGAPLPLSRHSRHPIRLPLPAGGADHARGSLGVH
jgi:hypothetical protein